MAGRRRTLTIHLEGHPGHSGNVLAHAFVRKLDELLQSMAALERAYTGRGQRTSDFEITKIVKRNPTEATLVAVPRVAKYNPAPFMDWAYRQYEAVNGAGDVDERVSAEVAEKLEIFGKERRDESYSRVWITYEDARPIDISDEFAARAGTIKAQRLAAREFQWQAGVSVGTLRGELLGVDDTTGEHEFFVVPPAGPDRIKCVFSESVRADVKACLFTTVEIEGLLHYSADSPHPYKVEAAKIRPLEEGPALKDLGGLLIGTAPSDLFLDLWDK